MRRTVASMETTGTAAFLNFRELGTEGALALREAATE